MFAIKKWPLFVFLTMLLSGCNLGQEVKVVQLYNGLHCQSEHGFHWLEDRAAIKVASGTARVLDASLQPGLQMTDVDLDTHRVVILSMGEQPSTGYGVELTTDSAILRNQILYLPIRFKAPLKEKKQASMVTTPCVILALPREGYQKVALLDRDISLALPSDPENSPNNK